MTLNSIYFIPFMIVLQGILVVLQLIEKRWRAGSDRIAYIQKIVILVFSYLFICFHNYRYCVLLLLTVFFVHAVGVQLEKKKSKWILTAGIVILVTELSFFKYTNFFLQNICSWMDKEYVYLKILLPLGISFYIFTSIGYLVDVYTEKYRAEHDLVNLALMISLFTKIIAGPIVKGEDFLPQIRKYRGISKSDCLEGIQIFCFGLFKKMVLADHLNVFVGDVYAAPSAFHSFSVLLAVISYSLQIFLDFSGYSDMAIGTSKMLGIHIEKNFDLPYIAKSPSEFWNRWHISLSSWLKEYLYIPLGGSRKGKARGYLNLMIVMLVSGLWHGAGWNFIMWGFLHGLYSCLFKGVDNLTNKKLSHPQTAIGKGILVLCNYIIVTVLWVFFRAESVSSACSILKGCFTQSKGIMQPYTWSFVTVIVLCIATAATVIVCRRKGDSRISGFYPCLELSKMRNQILFLVFIGITVIIGYYGDTAFIYGAF